MKISTLKKKAWKVFSFYIRHRDRGRCFTCGLQKDPREMQAGHFINAAVCGLPLYFSEINVNCQCYRCNINLGGYGAEYAKRLEQKYGKEAIEELYRQRDRYHASPLSPAKQVMFLQEIIDRHSVIAVA